MPDIITIMIAPAALITGALIGTWRTGLEPRTGLALRLPSMKHSLIFTAAFLVLMAIHEAVYQLAGMGGQENDWRKYAAGALVMRVVFVGLIYPLAEEFFFRGFLLGLITRKAGPAAGMIATSVLFSALHNLQGGWVGPLLVFTDGLYFSFARLRSGSLLLPVAFHIFGNSVAIIQRLY